MSWRRPVHTIPLTRAEYESGTCTRKGKARRSIGDVCKVMDKGTQCSMEIGLRVAIVEIDVRPRTTVLHFVKIQR